MGWVEIIALVLKLLESINAKDVAAAKGGYDGPGTAYFKARAARPDVSWDEDGDAYAAHCAAYLRVKAAERANPS